MLVMLLSPLCALSLSLIFFSLLTDILVLKTLSFLHSPWFPLLFILW